VEQILYADLRTGVAHFPEAALAVGLKFLILEPRDELHHTLAPRPESAAPFLTFAAQSPLERMRVAIHKSACRWM
jgi:hypothetical protein